MKGTTLRSIWALGLLLLVGMFLIFGRMLSNGRTVADKKAEAGELNTYRGIIGVRTELSDPDYPSVEQWINAAAEHDLDYIVLADLDYSITSEKTWNSLKDKYSRVHSVNGKDVAVIVGVTLTDRNYVPGQSDEAIVMESKNWVNASDFSNVASKLAFLWQSGLDEQGILTRYTLADYFWFLGFAIHRTVEDGTNEVGEIEAWKKYCKYGAYVAPFATQMLIDTTQLANVEYYTFVRASRLDRVSLELRKGRTYVSTKDGIDLNSLLARDLETGNTASYDGPHYGRFGQMSQLNVRPNGRFQIEAELVSKNSIEIVELWRDGELQQRYSPMSCSYSFSEVYDPFVESGQFRLYARDDEGNELWTAPVRVVFGGPLAADETYMLPTWCMDQRDPILNTYTKGSVALSFFDMYYGPFRSVYSPTSSTEDGAETLRGPWFVPRFCSTMGEMKITSTGDAGIVHSNWDAIVAKHVWNIQDYAIAEETFVLPVFDDPKTDYQIVYGRGKVKVEKDIQMSYCPIPEIRLAEVSGAFADVDFTADTGNYSHVAWVDRSYVHNSGWEMGSFDGWKVEVLGEGDAAILKNDKGDYMAEITLSQAEGTQGKARLSQVFDLPGSKEYLYSISLQTDNVNGLTCTISFYNDRGAVVDTMPLTDDNNSTSDWTIWKGRLQVPTGAVSASLEFVIQEPAKGQSHLWLDYVRITDTNGIATKTGMLDGNYRRIVESGGGEQGRYTFARGDISGWHFNVADGNDIHVTTDECIVDGFAVKTIRNASDIGNYWTTMGREFEIDDKSEYEYSYWLKQENAQQAHVRLVWLAANGLEIRMDFLQYGRDGTYGWEQTQGVIKPPRRAAKVLFQFLHMNPNDGIGSLWIDDVVFRHSGEQPAVNEEDFPYSDNRDISGVLSDGGYVCMYTPKTTKDAKGMVAVFALSLDGYFKDRTFRVGFGSQTGWDKRIASIGIDAPYEMIPAGAEWEGEYLLLLTNQNTSGMEFASQWYDLFMDGDPAYDVQLDNGEIIDMRWPLILRADESGLVSGTIGSDQDLINPLMVKVIGVQDGLVGVDASDDKLRYLGSVEEDGEKVMYAVIRVPKGRQIEFRAGNLH